MPDSIDPAIVQQVAALARIQLDEGQLESTAHQLAEILQYVGQLNQVALPQDVEPFFGACESVNALRPDTTMASEDRDVILANAPQTDGEFYVVPAVFK